MKIRFQDPFLFITGIGFGVLAVFVEGPGGLFSSFVFGACLGGLHLNHKERKQEQE